MRENEVNQKKNIVKDRNKNFERTKARFVLKKRSFYWMNVGKVKFYKKRCPWGWSKEGDDIILAKPEDEPSVVKLLEDKDVVPAKNEDEPFNY